MLSDEELVEAWKFGDLSAGEQLCDRYVNRIYSMMRNALSSPEDAEDLAQEVFFRAFDNIDDFRRKSTFSTWLYGIAKNVLRNHYHTKVREAKIIETDIAPIIQEFIKNVPSSESSVEDVAEFDEVKILVWDALQHIPDAQREVLLLRFWNNAPYKSIAQELGRTESAIKSLIHRAVRSCEKYILRKLAESGGDEGEIQ